MRNHQSVTETRTDTRIEACYPVIVWTAFVSELHTNVFPWTGEPCNEWPWVGGTTLHRVRSVLLFNIPSLCGSAGFIPRSVQSLFWQSLQGRGVYVVPCVYLVREVRNGFNFLTIIYLITTRRLGVNNLIWYVDMYRPFFRNYFINTYLKLSSHFSDWIVPVPSYFTESLSS